MFLQFHGFRKLSLNNDLQICKLANLRIKNRLECLYSKGLIKRDYAFLLYESHWSTKQIDLFSTLYKF